MESKAKAFNKGDRIESRISGWYGTVTMGGDTICQVLFDSADHSLTPTAKFCKDLKKVEATRNV